MSEEEHLIAVDAMLRQAGMTVPEDEVQRLAALYPSLRHTVDSFYTIDTGDEVTAAVLRADEDRANVLRADEDRANVLRADEDRANVLRADGERVR